MTLFAISAEVLLDNQVQKDNTRLQLKEYVGVLSGYIWRNM